MTTSLSPLDIGLCVPVLNERVALGPLLDEIAAVLGDAPHTVCIIDDGSTDGTVELVRARMESDPRLHLLQRERQGRGCRRGGASRAGLAWLVAHTRHTTFVDFDADGANDPRELFEAARRIGVGADVVIASKYVPGSRVEGRPLVRRLGSRVYSGMLRALFDPAVHDYSNSYRVYSRRAAELVLAAHTRYDTPVYLVEMLAVWLAHGLAIEERPTHYRARIGGESKVVWSDVARGFAGAFDVGVRFRRGGYLAR